MATTETSVSDRPHQIPLADLQPDPNQPRKYLDATALEELTSSIKEQKVIAPIVFCVEGGIGCITVGERFCTAAWKAFRPQTNVKERRP